MKRFAAIISVILTLCLLAGCQAKGSPPPLFTFSGISWNVTPAEFVEAMNLKESDYTVECDNAERIVLKADNIKVFGEKATVYFDFLSYAADYHGFCGAYVIYPEDVNFDTIRKRAENQYGEPIVPSNAEQTVCFWEGTETMEQYAAQLESASASRRWDYPATYLIWCSDPPSLHYVFPSLMYAFPSTNLLVFNGHVAGIMQYIEFGFTPDVPMTDPVA